MAASAGACVEDVLHERMSLRLLPDGGAQVAVRIDVAPPDRGRDRAVEERLTVLRRELLEERDAWTRRFERLTPAEERFTRDTTAGALTGVERRARLSDPDDLRRFFSDAPLTVSRSTGDGWAELRFVPDGGSRATSEQRARMDDALTAWSKTLADYFASLADLYADLERRPDRAVACIGSILGDLLPEAQRAALPPVRDADAALVKSVTDHLDTVFNAFDAAAGGDRSYEDLSRLVYDPFPAPLTIEAGDGLLQQEGFATGPTGRLIGPRLSLSAALEQLEGRWVEPDPAVDFIRWMRSIAEHAATERRVDLDGWLARPRRINGRPDAAEVRVALLRQLAPEPLYRVRWSVAPVRTPGKR